MRVWEMGARVWDWDRKQSEGGDSEARPPTLCSFTVARKGARLGLRSRLGSPAAAAAEPTAPSSEIQSLPAKRARRRRDRSAGRAQGAGSALSVGRGALLSAFRLAWA